MLKKPESSLSLPTHESNIDLANSFNDYFVQKISTLQSGLIDNNVSEKIIVHQTECELTTFLPASELEVRKIIMGSKSASCLLDPIPTWLLKDCLNSLMPSIMHIVNQSLENADMPQTFKNAVVLPLLKKPSLDVEIMKIIVLYRTLHSSQS